MEAAGRVAAARGISGCPGILVLLSILLYLQVLKEGDDHDISVRVLGSISM
jgi:hypothetical protein